MPGYMRRQQRAADVAGGFGALSKVSRMVLQSAVLGLGAYLVIEQQATAGIIIASSILTARALAPVELAIANWKGFVAARQSWERLKRALGAAAAGAASRMPLPRAERAPLGRGRRSAMPPGSERCRRAGCQLSAQGRQWARRHRPERLGQVVAGARACRRLAAGRGKVRLDGAALEQWAPEALGPPHRLPAAGCRAVRRHGGREHRPLRAGANPKAIIAAAQAARARADPAPAGRLRDPDRRRRRRRSRPASASGSRWPARSMASRSWSCSTSRTRTSTPRASRR